MKVLDPGHDYLLDPLDGEQVNRLIFVKREGERYPGNVGHHPGTNIQEVLRALIERGRYVNRQQPCAETEAVVGMLTTAIMLLEHRAARLHGRVLTAKPEEVISGAGKCPSCGHCGCLGDCRGRTEAGGG